MALPPHEYSIFSPFLTSDQQPGNDRREPEIINTPGSSTVLFFSGSRRNREIGALELTKWLSRPMSTPYSPPFSPQTSSLEMTAGNQK